MIDNVPITTPPGADLPKTGESSKAIILDTFANRDARGQSEQPD